MTKIMTRTHWFNKAAPGTEVACRRRHPDTWSSDLSQVTCKSCLRVARKATMKKLDVTELRRSLRCLS